MVDKIVSSIGRFSYRYRKPIAIFALVLFVCVAILQSHAVIEYSYAEESVVTDIFPQDDTVVLVYDNMDEDKIAQIIEYLESDEHVTSVQAYANTLGAKLTPSDVADLMGIDVSLVNTLFYIHENGTAVGGMTLVDFASFISSDSFLNNEMFASMIDDDTKAQVLQLNSIITALSDGKEYSAEEISDMLGIDEQLVQSIFYIAQFKDISISDVPAKLAATLAELVGMKAEDIEKLIGSTPLKSMKFADFVDVVYKVSSYAESFIDQEQLVQLGMLKQMSDMVTSEKELHPTDLEALFSSFAESDTFTEDNLTMLYIMAKSNLTDMSTVSIPLYDLFLFLSEDIMGNEAFSAFFDESAVAQFEEAKVTMEEGKAQLISDKHSRMVFTLDYIPESKQIQEFYVNLSDMLDDTFEKEYYLVGSSAMSHEISNSFSEEYIIISIVTAVAVFAVVLITFKKFFISLLLIFIIEGAVFSMMSVMTLAGSPMFFIALILVQCILMGSMIDYGILFTTYYTEVREKYSVEEALPEVMRRATHAILTSSTIIIFVTLLCSVFMTGAVASILKTLGIGALCAIILILFVLPSLLVIFDKFFIKNSTEVEEVDPFE